MSELEFLDLAPGDPVSQDGSLRAFRYSEFSDCPSAPFNTAVPECLPSLFHLSTSITTSLALELEDHSSGALGEPSSGLPNSLTPSDALVGGEICNSGCTEILQPDESFSDSLGLSLFDAYPWSKKCESSSPRACDLGMSRETAQVPDVVDVSGRKPSPLHPPTQDSPRRMFCNSQLLDEETLELDAEFLSSTQQPSYLLSPTKQHLQSAHQAFDSGHAISDISVTIRKDETKSVLKVAVEPKQSLPLVKEGCREVGDFDDICERWHSRKIATAIPSSSAAAIGLPSESDLDRIRQNTSHAFDSGYFQGQPTISGAGNENPSTEIKQDIIAALRNDDDADIVWRWHNRKRVALSSITNLNSSSDSDPCKKFRKDPKIVVESREQHSGPLHSQDEDHHNWSVPRYGHGRPCKDSIPSRDGSETTEEDVSANGDIDDGSDSKLLRSKLNHSCDRGIKRFLQVVTERNGPRVAVSSTDDLAMSKPELAEKQWSNPRKSRPGVRQRTMDAWIK